MIALAPGAVGAVADPFPHAVVDNALAPDVFAALEADYPECPPASGPTGHTIHRGDAVFDTVMEGSSAWRALFEMANSQAFTDQLAAVFADEIGGRCFVAAGDLRHVDHVESRTDKERRQTRAPVHPRAAVFTRFDFMQGMNAYARQAHLDHRRRLATLLLYFDSPGPDTFGGGDLVLHDADGVAVKRIAPAANRAVLFPCSDRSWHSVDAVTDCKRPRRFMQIAVSSEHDLWPDARLPDATMLGWGKRKLRALLAA